MKLRTLAWMVRFLGAKVTRLKAFDHSTRLRQYTGGRFRCWRVTLPSGAYQLIWEDEL